MSAQEPHSDPPAETISAPSAGQSTTDPARAARQMVQHFGLQVGPAPDAFLDKLEPQHITQLLSAAENDSVRGDSRTKQIFWGSIVVSTVATLFMCWIFLHYEKSELLKDTLQILLTAIVSFAGGFGFGRTTKKAE